MMLLKEKNPVVYKRLEFLMDGDTSDLQEKNSFSRWAFTFYVDKRTVYSRDQNSTYGYLITPM